MIEERIGAFIEYTLRPLSEDVRLILERLKELNLPLTEENIRHALLLLGRYHIMGEFIRAVTYIVISGMTCYTVIRVLH